MKDDNGSNIHGIGPDTDGGPNPDYVPPTDVLTTTTADLTYETRNAFSVIQRELTDMLEVEQGAAEREIIERKQKALADLREFVLGD